MESNGKLERPAVPSQHDEDLEILDDWIFLVPTNQETGTLAQCGKYGLTVDCWAKQGIERGLRGRNVILVFPGKETADQIAIIKLIRESKAENVRIWRPTFYGDPALETLEAYSERFDLARVVAMERPWELVPEESPAQKIKANGHLTIGLDEVLPEKVDWLYENRIAPRFITLFAGRSGFGKSFVTCDIVARLSRGEPPPYSVIQQAPLRTLFISEDSPQVVLGPRLLELKADPRMVKFMGWNAMADYTLSDTAMLERAYQECQCPAVVVIDPPANFLGTVDEHKNAEVRAVLKGIIAWLDLHRVAMILITHINKQIGKGMDAVERIMGSVAWGTTARITCAFTKDPDCKGQFLFGGTKNNLGELAETLAYQIVKTDNLATIKWEGKSETTMDDAIDHVRKKSKGAVAVEWLEARFREKREWDASELRAMGKEHGVTTYALYESQEVLGLPIIKRKRMNANGEQHWVWVADEGWPKTESESSESSEPCYESPF